MKGSKDFRAGPAERCRAGHGSPRLRRRGCVPEVRRLRQRPAKAKPSHVCPVRRAASGNVGAFFRSNNSDVFYKMCVQLPRRPSPSCAPRQEADQGRLYVNTITSDHTRPSQGDLVRQGPAGRRLVLPPEVSVRPATVGFDTATEDTAVCASAAAAAVRGVDRDPRRRPSPVTRPRCCRQVERAAAAAGGWERGRRDPSASGGAPARSPASESGSRPRGRWRSAGAAGPRCLHARRARRTARRGGRGPARAGGLDARRGEVFAALYDPGARGVGAVVVAPAELGERLSRAAGRPLAAGSGALRFRDELAGEASRSPSGPTAPPGRGAGRSARSRGGGAGSADGPDLPESTRRRALA